MKLIAALLFLSVLQMDSACHLYPAIPYQHGRVPISRSRYNLTRDSIEKLLDNLAWPASLIEPGIRGWKTFHTKNNGNQLLRYCVETDGVVYNDVTIRGVLEYVLSVLEPYVQTVLKLVDTGSCDVRVSYKEYAGNSVGIYFPRENSIIVKKTNTLSIMDIYKVTMHEVLHSLGLDHSDWPSVMTPNLRSDSDQLIFKRDVRGLQSIHYIGRFYEGRHKTIDGDSDDQLNYIKWANRY